MARLASLSLLLACSSLGASQDLNVRSGGPLPFEQAVYDVQSYDISLNVDPATKTISGTTVMVARATMPTDVILLDLDKALQIEAVTDGQGRPLRFERGTWTLRVWFPASKQAGDEIKTSIRYKGSPRVARNAPWDGAFVWAKTPSGAPWVSVALQGEGADLLFPCKDHPSDKPSSAWMRFTVPDPLMAVGPGKLQGHTKNADGTNTWNWKMSVPIANYSLVFNAAPYKVVEDSAPSVTGRKVPIQFYVLPEDESKAPGLIAELKKYLAFMEKYCGPYAFQTEKLGVVQTPHLGMEHSTAIAYGNRFRYSAEGFDWLLLHEFGHEWWANLVTASDWKDFWIHEGFQTYMDTLYLEETRGQEAYLQAMKGKNRSIQNQIAVAPVVPTASDEIYGGDIYDKGALVLHNLRYLIGDKAFFASIRRMAYPTKEMEALTDGSQQRLVSTNDFITIAEQESGKELRWFFNVLVHQPKLPKLVVETVGKTLQLRWETPDNLPYPMPVDVVVDGKTERIPMVGGKGTVSFAGAVPVVDPKGWLLKA